MTAKHAEPEYRRNARIVRQQVDRARRFGDAVTCQRCRREIEPGQAYDVGHLDEHGEHGRDNLGPEHRYRADCLARGNRSHGGRLGAALTNARRGARTNSRRLAWRLADSIERLTGFFLDGGRTPAFGSNSDASP